MIMSRIWSLAGALGLAALLLCSCGVSVEPRPTQYAALHPADQPLAALPSVHVFPEKPPKPRPVQSLLEMRRENVVIQSWDLSCGAAALATLLRYEFGDNITEKEIAHGLMRRNEYIDHPEIVQAREGFSLLDLKRYVQTRGYKGVGLGKLELQDLIEHAPIMVPVDALGYNHFVIFRGVRGNRALLADPAWGNRTMTIEKFQRMWLTYGDQMGHVGFAVERPDGREPPSRMRPKLTEFVMLQ
jgi:predicted double-glycine peptidase